MTGPESSTPDYSMGFGEEILQALRRYTAEASAAYLLPYLRPGLRVLDFGSGPGTISVGLAKAVHPGELHGVDMEQSQVDLATAIATGYQQNNAVFHRGDVTDLHFEDDFFDVAHCHNVLMHVPDTQAVLGEVKRVLKPGGIIACREMICDSSFTHPHFGALRRAWEMFADLIASDEGHPQMGKDLKGHLARAGFEDIRAGASFDVYHLPEDIEFIYGVAIRWFLSPEILDAAVKYGASSAEVAESVRVAYSQWKDDPGAFAALAYGNTIAYKPLRLRAVTPQQQAQAAD